MSKFIQRIVDAEIKFHQKVCKRLPEDWELELSEEFDEALGGPAKNFIQVGMTFDEMARNLGSLAIVNLIDGNQELASIQLGRSMEYYSWSMLLSIKTFLNRTDLGPTVGVGRKLGNMVAVEAACLFLYHQSRETPRAKKFTELVRIMIHPDVCEEGSWEETPVSHFVKSVVTAEDWETVPPTIPNHLAFADCFGDEESRGNVEYSLDELCNEHCEQMEYTDDCPRPGFDNTPFDVIPIEIQFIQHMRKRYGLPEVTVSHPLLETGAAELFPQPELPDDWRIAWTEKNMKGFWPKSELSL